MSRETLYIPGGTPQKGDARGLTGSSISRVKHRKWGNGLTVVLSVFIGALLTVVALIVFRYYRLGWEIIVPAMLPLAMGSMVAVYHFFKNR